MDHSDSEPDYGNELPSYVSTTTLSSSPTSSPRPSLAGPSPGLRTPSQMPRPAPDPSPASPTLVSSPADVSTPKPTTTTDAGNSLTPIAGLKGVKTCPPLALLDLGIIDEARLLCCTSCSPARPLYVQTALSHIKDTHRSTKPGWTIPKLVELCQALGVYENQLIDFPLPDKIREPYDALPVENGFSCQLCERKGKNKAWLGTSKNALKTHFEACHIERFERREHHIRPTKVQSFAPPSNKKRKYFEVAQELVAAREEDPGLSEIRGGVTAQQLIEAHRSMWTEVPRTKVAAHDLRTAAPFEYFTGFANYLKGADPEFLCSLLELPEPGGEFSKLVALVKREWEKGQKALKEGVDCYRKSIMDQGVGGITGNNHQATILSALQDNKEYEKTYCQWVVVQARIYKLQKDQDPRAPNVIFTEGQKACLEQALLYSAGSSERQPGSQLMTDFSRWFWGPPDLDDFRHMEDNPLKDGTALFALIRCLKPQGNFLEPSSASRPLAQIRYIIRMGLLMWAKYQSEKEEKSQREFVAQITPAVVLKNLCPFSVVSSYLEHAQRYAKTTVRPPNVSWADNDVVVVEGKAINFKAFGNKMGHHLTGLERELKDDVLFGLSPEDDLDFNVDRNTLIIDDPSSTDPNYSLFTDRRNPFCRMTNNLASRLFSHPPAAHMVRGIQNGKVVWDPSSVNKWLGAVDKFTHGLMFGMHGIGGQPGRSSETVIIKVHNSAHRARSFIMIGPGQGGYILYYSKTGNYTGNDRVAFHGLPWRVTRLFLVLHAIVTPLVGQLLELTQGPEARAVQHHSAFSAFGKEYSPQSLGKYIKNWFKKELLVEDVGILLFRQLVVACQREKMPEAFEPMKQLYNTVDLQAGHTGETAWKHYAITPQQIARADSGTIKQFWFVSARYWYVLLGDIGFLDQKELQDAKAAPSAIARLSQDPQRQATTLAQDFEARVMGGLDDIKTLVLEVRDLALKTASQPAPAPIPTPVPTSRHTGDTLAVGPAVASRKHVGPRHLLALRYHLGDDEAVWNCEAQAQAFVHILARETSLLVVLPTGGGKSALYGALKYLETGVTAVVYPLRALMNDQVSRYGFTLWEPTISPTEGVVAVSVEAAGNSQFRHWATQLHSRGLLNRIILDECHITLLAQDYRPAMKNVRRLVETKVPLVGLSASVPPLMEEPVRQQLGDPSWRVIRAGTQVSNVHLAIGVYETRSEALKAVVRHVQHYTSQLKEGESIMVCCRTYRDVDEVAAALGAQKYVSRMEKGLKDKVAEGWLKGEFTTIVGTSAISTGMHNPGCRLVIMLGVPYGTIDYAQICGRAGRAQKLGIAALMAWKDHPKKPTRESFEPQYSGYKDLLKVVDSGECVRKGISMSLDGDCWSTCFSLCYTLCGRCVMAKQQASAYGNQSLGGLDLPGGQVVILPAGALIPHLPQLSDPQGNVGPSQEINPVSPVQVRHPTPLLPADQSEPTISFSASQPSRPMFDPNPSPVRQSDIAMAYALPPLPVGPLVVADAETSVLRRMTEAGLSPDETKHRPIDFETLLDTKDRIGNEWCAWCLLGQAGFRGHLVNHCPQLAGKLGREPSKSSKGNYRLEGVREGEMDFETFKKGLKFPHNSTICWCCNWPFHSTHGHPLGKIPQSCTHGDLIRPLLWLIWWQPEYRRKMTVFFSLGPEVSTAKEYATWLSQSVRISLGGAYTVQIQYSRRLG